MIKFMLFVISAGKKRPAVETNVQGGQNMPAVAE
jgi:hypothetical protein